MRTSTLPNFLTIILLALSTCFLACGRKGDPIPKPRHRAKSCETRWISPRVLEAMVPREDVEGDTLVGIDKIWVFYLPLGTARPTPQEVMGKGEVILERRRPDLPDPGQAIHLDLTKVAREPGWIVVTALRVGDIVGQPSETLPWLHPSISAPSVEHRP